MRANAWVIRIGVPVLFIIGFFLPWWPLMFVAPFIAAFYGYWLPALLLAWCADLIFGTPVGLFHSLVFPCTVAVVLSIVARSVIIRHLR
ncbi:hypothetical protein A2419_02740 [Candidatus Adlerbacteria bacterium RIFOXYC1_FULL_48_26]|uniref:Rod shape-determining protein MreD n=1 Tax=Candidatus Adlerbacteria bacterium RIFOXYC1_FULL_48_26 TaxID=1797247 RepID=A0A1F4Y3N0_9BACT|nr:MAG: hypothetical protein A2419_02740 [Candidatus Adlerbacteria bacterium RIFOXYC1_FULL_48_26]OGC94304.1 MAG: hypothetical protein A2389_02155 [Candidatus Adlerbacteria bacterium RIFOXYB1_FULL_48_10]OGC96653.1 MAG: hypothetical protein A2590_01940 [Candidatus Adlerbacteria bacterium RIFOXYD1_FULL_48_8]